MAGPANLRALYNDSAGHAKGILPPLETQPTSNEPTFYGIDRGYHDYDLGKNDDMNAIGGTSPLLQRESLDTPLEEPADYSWAEFGFGIDSSDAQEADGGYYSKPVSILIPQSLEPLPDRLLENPMNLLVGKTNPLTLQFVNETWQYFVRSFNRLLMNTSSKYL